MGRPGRRRKRSHPKRKRMFSGRTLGKVPELKGQEGQGRKKWVKTLAPESGRLQHMLLLLSEALGLGAPGGHSG